MKKRRVREGVEGLVPYPPGKPIEELEREMGIRGSIKLASNENPLGTSSLAVQAIRDRLTSLHRYPDGSGYYLKAKLSERFRVPGERIILGNGSNELIELTVRTFLSEGDQAIQAFPSFLVYEKFVAGAGGRMTSVPLTDFRVNLEGMVEAIGPKTRVIFITNPNNPTGLAISGPEMIRFLDRVPEDVVVVLDEAYIEFATDENVADGLQLLDSHPSLFVMRTFSKLYGLAGLRIGYGFGPVWMIDYMNRLRQPFNANTLAQAAATAALDDHQFVSETLKTVQEGLVYLYQNLGEMGLEYLPTQTNFVLIRVPQGGRVVYERMLREGVIIRAMDSYGLPEHIRVCVGLPAENRRFIETLRRVLSGL